MITAICSTASSQLDLFRWREGHITASVAQRFRGGLGEAHDPFEVFRAVQNHAIDAAAFGIPDAVLVAPIALRGDD